MTSDLATLGGKGANLVRLREAGFPVPPFVILATDEYLAFVSANALDAVITDALTLDAAAASDAIRAAFRRPLEAAQRERIAAVVSPLADRPVAVRSSATAEDLPEASFAGQQETVLGVRGVDAILEAVVECWSSLWTERAITYRSRNDVPQDAVSLAVVVQELVDAEASGVLFTADPLTGHRGHAVVDAVFGLGERLVSGQVVPDHYEVDAAGAILSRSLQGERATLSDAQLTALVDLGRRVAALDGQPQDLEWTRVGDTLQLVQTRAITSLYPLPEGGPGDALWFSFGAFQGMLDPITPLGQDALRLLLADAAPLFGRRVDYRTNAYARVAGERLWVRLDALLRTLVGHRALPRVLGAADPNAAELLGRFALDPAYAPLPGSVPRTVRALRRFVGHVVPGTVRSLARPEAARARLVAEADAIVADIRERTDAADAIARPELRLAARLRALDALAAAGLRVLLPAFGPIMAPSLLMIARLRALAAATGLPDSGSLALAVMRALPGNVTTEMDLALWGVARVLRDDPASAELVGTDPADLAARYLAGTLPAAVQESVGRFLDRYGMRGVAEIDLGTPRWRERPEDLFRTLGSLLTLDADRAPDASYEAGRREAEATLERLAVASSRTGAVQVRFAGSRLRGLFGGRETPKFALIRGLGLLRTALQASGRDLMDAGVLADPDDVFFLHLDELHDAFGRRDLRPLVAERRAARQREQRRRRVPLLLVGDGRTFYDAGTGDPNADLTGLGVSPGVVVGVARVVDDPRTSDLQPGEILVCRGTDPAWTPLFLTAGGLVTEVGGFLTHGSVIAREYGLPAVVGVAGATEVLRPGQRIRLDGSAGTITFVKEN